MLWHADSHNLPIDDDLIFDGSYKLKSRNQARNEVESAWKEAVLLTNEKEAGRSWTHL